MMVTVEQIQNGITKYVDRELGSKCQGMRKFLVYFTLPRIRENVHAMVEEYRHNVLFADMFSDDGQIDLDKAFHAAKEAMQRVGIVEIAGIQFNEQDIDMLYRHITQ